MKKYKSEEAIRGAIENNPMDPELHFQLGVWIFENGKEKDCNYLHRAMDEFDKASAINAQEGKYYFYRGLCSIDMGNPTSTTNSSFNKAIHLGYKIDECKRLMEEAEIKYDAEYKRSQSVWLEGLENGPDNAHKYSQLGTHYYWKDRKKALPLLEKALEYDPFDSNANHLIGKYLGEQGNMEKALEHFKKIDEGNKKYDPDHEDQHYDDMARIYEGKDDWVNAIIWRKKMYELYPDDFWSAEQYGSHLYKLGKEDEAVKVFMKILEMNPDDHNANVYSHLAGYYSHRGDIDNVFKYLNEGLKHNPNSWFFHLNLGHIYDYIKEYDLAEKFFLNAVVYRLDNDEAYIRLGKMYLREDHFDIKKSRNYLLKALEINPESIFAHEKLSEIYLDLKDSKKAKYHQSRTQELKIAELYPNAGSKNFEA